MEAPPAPAVATAPTPSLYAPIDRTRSFEQLRQSCKLHLRSTFGLQRLRLLQPAAIRTALKGRSQTLVLATGGGKSLCYQLPAVVLGGTTIVVSPLIALMDDQVHALQAKKIAAAVLSSSQKESDNLLALERLLGRRLRAPSKKPLPPLTPLTMLYTTPEQVQSARFRDILRELHQQHRLAMFAIDEAHCLSTWGHDFRPAYRQLTWLRQALPAVPVMALTATATPGVVRDIQTILRLESDPLNIGSFDRANIAYRVAYKDVLEQKPGGALRHLTDFIQKRHLAAEKQGWPCSGIVYVHKRDDTQLLVEHIRRNTSLTVAAYHGGLSASARAQVQADWTSGRVSIAIATVAFGMGVDLAHVRYVIHWSLAKSVEGFYQESGRAGRDGKEACSLLYYARDDVSKFEFLARQQRSKNDKEGKGVERALGALQKMVHYAIEPQCRRQYLLKHFGEKHTDPVTVCRKSCDYCHNPEKVKQTIGQAQSASTFGFRTKATDDVWDGQWDKPHGDDDADDVHADCRQEVDDLSVTECIGDDFSSPIDGLMSAKSKDPIAVLAKYEAIEFQSNQTNGFVHFRKRGLPPDPRGGSRDTVKVPEHFRQSLASATTSFASKTRTDERRTSSDYVAEAARLQADLVKLKAEKERSSLLANRHSERDDSPPPPPPPPPLSFGTYKKRR